MPFLVLRFLLQLDADFVQLLNDPAVVFGDTVKLGQGPTRMLDTAMAEIESGTFGEEGHAGTKNEGKEESQAQGDPPLRSALEILRSQVDAVRQEDTQRDEQLVRTDHGTSDMAGSALTLVHGNHERAATDSQTGHPTADDHLPPMARGSGNLNNQPHDRDDTPDSDGPPTADPVGDGGAAQRADESTDRQQTNNQTGTDIAEVVFALLVEFTVALEVVRHLLETGDLTSIITEEDTTHGDEGAKDEGPPGEPGDGGLDADVGLLLGDGLHARSLGLARHRGSNGLVVSGSI